MSETLSDLLTRSLYRAGMTGVVDTTSGTAVIRAACRELYDLLVESFEDYAISSGSATLTASSTGNSISLASSGTEFVYKWGGLEKLITTGEYQDIPWVEWGDRNVTTKLSYTMVGANVHVLPWQKAEGSFRYWYVPVFDGTATSFSGLGFEEFAVITAAIEFKDIEESDTSRLLARKAELKSHIQSMARKRNVANPRKARDVRRGLRFWLKQNDPDRYLG